MLTIKKNGVIIDQAKSNEYKPTWDIEKEKPYTLYVNSEDKERGLSNE